MKERTSLICGESDLCDYSNKRIKTMEPRFIIYHLPIVRKNFVKTENFKVKYNNIQNFKNSLKNAIKTKEETYEENYTCPHMETDYYIETEEYEGARKKNLYSCKKCIDELINKLEKIEEERDKIKYWSTNGICVREPTSEKSLLMGNKDDEKLIVIFGGEAAPSQVSVGLSDIYNLYNLVCEGNISQGCGMSAKRCLLCRKRLKRDESTSYIYTPKGEELRIHNRDCLRVLKTELESIIENYSSYLVSNKI